MTEPRLVLSRSQILAHRRRVGALDQRLPSGRRSLRRAGWAGFQDSMPRAALLSIHARVEGTSSTVLEDPALVQVWGPRFSVYVVPVRDLAVFTVGRTPDDPERRSTARELADRLRDLLGDQGMSERDAARALGERPNYLKYATTTGTIVIRWDGARQPTIRVVPAPDVDPGTARLELARRYLHVCGPATSEAFAAWAGIRPQQADASFGALRRSLTPVRTATGDARILSADEASFLAAPDEAAPVRLLPSGDTYYLLQGDERALLVPDADQRASLWTSRVWPGALLLHGDIVGTWRRARHKVTIQPWRPLSPAERDLVEAEAASLPLPGLTHQIVVSWDG
jgi:hypothetical protein